MKSIPVIIYNNKNTSAAKSSKSDKHKVQQILRTVEINLIYKSNNLMLQFH
jgi:hypothetical protein